MSHEAICPCNLQCNFCRKKYSRLQLTCQTYATCFATCNEIIFYPRRVFKNVSGILIMSYCHWFLLKKIARHVAVGVSHAATCRVALWKVEAASSFSATGNPIFRSRLTWGVTRGSLATYNATPFALQVARKIASCDMALSHGFSRWDLREICDVTNYGHVYMYILIKAVSSDAFVLRTFT